MKELRIEARLIEHEWCASGNAAGSKHLLNHGPHHLSDGGIDQLRRLVPDIAGGLPPCEEQAHIRSKVIAVVVKKVIGKRAGGGECAVQA